jgi:hypothetical protein
MSAAIIGGVVFMLVLVALVAYFLMSGGDAPGPAPALPPVEPENLGADQTGAVAMAQEGAEDEDAPEQADQGETIAVEVDENKADFDPKSISGLVGWYDGASWNDDDLVWADKSGNNNDATEILGAPEAIDGDDTSGGVKYLIGGLEDGLRFPQEVLTRGKKFTMFHVSRYNAEIVPDYNKPGMGRIFDGTDANFLSGSHGGHVALAYREGAGALAHWHRPEWGTPPWYDIFTVNTDQKHLYRFQGLQRSGVTNHSAITPTQMSINYGQARAGGWGGHGEKSIWAVAEVLFYDRELTIQEILNVEDYLFARYKLKKLVMSPTWPYNRFKQESQGIDGTGAICGDMGGIHSTRNHRHHSWNAEQEKWLPNGHQYFESGCTQNISAPGSKKKSTRTVDAPLNEGAQWQGPWKTLMDMNCGNSPIQGYEFEKVGQKMKTNYSCSPVIVNKDSCETKRSYRHYAKDRPADQGLHAGIHLDEGQCWPKVMTSIKTVDDIAGASAGNDQHHGIYEVKCCALEDQ